MQNGVAPRLVNRVPMFAKVIAWIALIACIVMMIVGAWVVGITWDEKSNMMNLQSFFDSGWNVPTEGIVNGQPDPHFIWGIYVYGPVSELFSHIFGVLSGNENWGHLTYSSQAFAARHLAIPVFGLLGIAAGGFAVRIITKSWGWALLGATAVAIVPMWTGHSMMNIKDVPVASGYSVATLGLVLMMTTDYFHKPLYRFGGPLLLIVGAVISSGTRMAGAVPIAVGAVFAFVIWWLIQRLQPDSSNRKALVGGLRRLVDALVALIIAYGLLILLYPKAFANPIKLAWEAIVGAAHFPFDEPIMVAGSWINQPAPWSYLPLWFGAQLPLLILAGAGIFVVVWFVQLILAFRRRSKLMVPDELLTSLPVGLQALFVPIIAILTHSTMYNGSRQFLMAVPAISILAVLGIWIIFRWLSARNVKTWIFTTVWAVVSLGIVIPVAAQLSLFPYNYTYYNGVTALAPIDGNWPTDYWRASSNELMRRLPAVGEESCAYEQTRKHEHSACSKEPMFGPYLETRGIEAKPGTLAPGHYWVVRENQGIVQVPQGCVLHDQITRQLFWRTITIGQIMDCDASAVIQAAG